MKITRIIVEQAIDEKGQLEEFTSDIYPLVDSGDVLHLEDNGLPKSGTLIADGMVIVGKTGRGAAFDPGVMPTAIEWQGLEREELATRYANYWTNTSRYATKETEGTVVRAYFETKGGKLCAIVEMNLNRTSQP